MKRVVAAVVFVGCATPRTARVSAPHQDGDAVWWTETVADATQQGVVGSGGERTYWVLCFKDRLPPCARFEPVDVPHARSSTYFPAWAATRTGTPTPVAADAGTR